MVEDGRSKKQFLCGLPREREKKYVLRFHAKLDKIRNAVDNRAGLSRARAGDDEMRPVDRGDRFILLGIQIVLVIDLELLRMNDVQLGGRLLYKIFLQERM